MFHWRLIMVLGVAMLAGCGSAPPKIPVNDKQTLVMEASLLGAGVTAQAPDVELNGIRPLASSQLYNERNAPITVHYRFYWYDVKGLEMHPLEAPRSVVVPARGAVTIFASSHFPGATKVRLYLYL